LVGKTQKLILKNLNKFKILFKKILKKKKKKNLCAFQLWCNVKGNIILRTPHLQVALTNEPTMKLHSSHVAF
jgi:hypothetical protein